MASKPSKAPAKTASRRAAPAKKAAPVARGGKRAARPTAAADIVEVVADVVMHLSTDRIVPDPDQPRRHFAEDALQALADDIAVRGVLQPIVVRPGPADDYIIVVGERRWRASKLAGRTTIPAVVRQEYSAVNADPLDRFLDQVAENMLRQDLGSMEIAEFLRRLRDEHGIKVARIPDVCAARGLKEMSRSYVSNMIRLTDLPQWAQDMVRAGTLSAHHGRELLSIVDLPELLEDVRLTIAEWDHQFEGAMTVERLVEVVEHLADNKFIHVSRRWQFNAPLYDVEKARAKHPELGIRKIGGSEYITNLALHEQLNAEQKARTEARQAKKAAAQQPGQDLAAAASLAPARTVNKQKLRAYLHEYVVHALRAWLDADGLDAERRSIRDGLILWAASGGPIGGDFDPSINGGAGWGQDRRTSQREALCARFGRRTLLHFIGPDVPQEDEMHTYRVAAAIIGSMEFAQLTVLAGVVGWQLSAWRIDAGFCALHTRSELEALARKGALDMLPSYRNAKKTQDLREFLIEHADNLALAAGVPASLQEIWDHVVEYEGDRRGTEDDEFGDEDDDQQGGDDEEPDAVALAAGARG